MTEKKISTYSPEQKVGVQIYRHNILNEPIYFSKLVNIFEGEISRNTINKVLDKLFDLCMVDADWEEVDNKWIRSLHISGGEYMSYFKMLHDNVYDDLKSVEETMTS
jgi:hypothetical protein